MTDLNSEDYFMYLLRHLPQIYVGGSYYGGYYGSRRNDSLSYPEFSSEMKINLYLRTLNFFKEKGMLVLNAKGTKYIVNLDNFITLHQRDREIFSQLIDRKDFKFVLGQPSSANMETLATILWSWARDNGLITKNYEMVEKTDKSKIKLARTFWTGGGVLTTIAGVSGIVGLFNGIGFMDFVSLGGVIAGGAAIAGGFPLWKKRTYNVEEYESYASISDKGKKWIMEQNPAYNGDKATV